MQQDRNYQEHFKQNFAELQRPVVQSSGRA